MASVLPPSSATAKLDAALEQELGKATSRIRLNDLLVGGLMLIVLSLAFTAGMVLLDRWLVLPQWLRQGLLASFLLTLATVGYFLVMRPFLRVINPRFAARRVEESVPETKNAFINWVDLRDRDLPAAVRAAVDTRAMEGVAEADVNKAVESKRVVWLAATAGLLIALLAALFVIFKPAPFLSLVSRTFNPFSVTKIASRTELSIEEPKGGDVTVTSGDPVTIRVYVGGSIPDPTGAGKVRLRVRYNPDAPDYDELPLDPGGSARDWVLRVPQAVVQNGFWYTVAGGDAETTEHRVTVRSRPLFKEFEARYVYPAYTRLKPEVAREPALWGYRGTEVTLITTTNRQVKRGWLQIDGQTETIVGQVVGGARDSLQFRFTLQESGTYRLGFTSVEDEPGEPTPSYPIKIAEDRKPWPQITAPAEDEIALPANGLLQVDGTLEDDFGLTSAALALRVVGEDGKTLHILKSKPYREGKPFRRESDGTFPTKMTYKDSVSLTALVDHNGKPVQLADKMVLEFWLEATDNCTEPKPNVGKSAVKRVRVVPPPQGADQKRQQDQTQRGADEQKHQQQQDQQLQTEKRDPPPQLRPEEKQGGEPKNNDGANPEQGSEGSRQPNEGNAKNNQTPSAKSGTSGENSTTPPEQAPEPKGNPNEQSTPSDTGNKPQNSTQQPTGKQPESQESSSQNTSQTTDKSNTSQQNDPSQAEKQAQEVQNAIDQQNRQPGDGRNDPDHSKTAESPADKKPAGQTTTGEQSEPKSGQSTDPQGQTKGSPSGETKPAGNLEQPKPADQKSEPQPAGNETQQPNQQGKPGSESTGNTPKHPPVAGNTPAQERPQPKASEPEKSSTSEPQHGEKQTGEMKPADASAARGNEAPSQSQTKQGQNAGESKPKPETSRAEERTGEGAGTDQANPQERPAEVKGSKPTEPGTSKKPSPSTQPNSDSASSDKPQPSPDATGQQNTTSAAKPEGSKPPSTANAGNQKSGEKGSEKSAQSPGQNEKQVDPREIEQAAKDLASGDPQKQQAARDKLDKMMGKEAREKAERDAKQLAEDLQSSDPNKKQAAEQKLKDLANQVKQQGGAGQGEQKIDPKEIEQAAKDLASNDPQKQQAARDKLDKMMGKEAREKAERDAKQLAEDLQSGDTAKRQAAEQKLKDLAQKAGQDKPQTQAGADQKEIEQATKDLASGNPQKQQAARDKLDKMMGKEAREKAERDAKQISEDLNSNDPARKQAAEQKLNDLAKQANPKAGQNDQGTPLSDEEKQKLTEKAKDLTSDDPKKREAAEKEFDKAVGQERREQLQQLAKDAQSGDPKKQEAAQKQIDEMMKNASKGSQGQQPTAEELKQWADKAKDLNSPDPGKRETAEKEFDNKFGQEARQNLQEAMKDPKKAEEARKKFEEMARNFNKELRPGGGASRGQEGTLHESDPRNRLKSAELQLKTFEKNRDNKELQNKLGYTQEEYDRFLQAQQQRVAQMREEVAKMGQQGTEPQPTGPTTLKVGEGSGNKKIDTRPNGAAGPTGNAGPGTAPAGYSEAQRKFAEKAKEAAKQRNGQDKK